uniref:Hflx-type G domain-containing protein n=1 Tax=Guillardia theta TaxID=55529 RepID=A0A7S4H8F6_GUITH|mmetsp:Transcript_10308/g.34405  ORF Transcript_10308/g.34405 Transcript_10308/m.34405 type:complete len:523 (+) Transcript_10308:394-1962(+)
MPGMISFALLWSMVMSVGHVHAFTLIPGPHCLSKRCADLPLGQIGRSKIPFQRPRGRWSDGPKRFSSLNMNLFGSETITTKKGDRAYIVGADIKRNRYKTLESSWEVDDSLDELQRLCETAGLVVLGREFQSMQNPSPSTFIGAGKVEALAKTVKTLEIDVVVFDDELSPAQGRNIQTILGEDVRVLDRTMLILQIFAQRARTREAKLQVQAAQMKYMMPRLQYFMTEGAGMEARGGGGGGGKNLKGMGESQIEADKRLFRKQLQNVEKEMEEVKQQREVYRTKRRERDNLPIIAIVGYTNAGKSTMLNKLCGSEEVYADDLLFATLDPTTRKLRLPGGKEVLVSDTVGFIQKLPTKLVSSFRATLEEIEDASLILHVVDAASPLAQQQIWSVQNIIEELMLEDTPQILVLNKMDACDKEKIESPAWLRIHERVIPECTVATSAKSGDGLAELLDIVEEALLQLSVMIECLLPYSASDLLAEIHKVGTIIQEDFQESGTRVVAYVPPSLRNKLEKYSTTGTR